MRPETEGCLTLDTFVVLGGETLFRANVHTDGCFKLRDGSGSGVWAKARRNARAHHVIKAGRVARETATNASVPNLNQSPNDSKTLLAIQFRDVVGFLVYSLTVYETI